MQPYLADELTDRNQSLKHLFCVKQLNMKVKPKKSEAVKQTGGKYRGKGVQVKQAQTELRGEEVGETVTDPEDVLDEKGYKSITRPAVRKSLNRFFVTHFVQVICSDPDQLVQMVLQERGMNPHSSLVLTGMDDGQGFCKIAAVFLDTDAEDESTGRSKYSEVKKQINFGQ